MEFDGKALLDAFQLKPSIGALRQHQPASHGDHDGLLNNVTSPASKLTGPLSPLRHPAFAVLWTVTVVSNVGTWLQSAAAGWLMTSLNPNPLIVAMVQVATTLPMFLL